MKTPNDYWSGPHHFWTHFWCGLVVGGGLGTWICWDWFENKWLCVLAATAIALTFALACGRRGDRAWHWLLQNWR